MYRPKNFGGLPAQIPTEETVNLDEPFLYLARSPIVWRAKFNTLVEYGVSRGLLSEAEQKQLFGK